MPARPFRAAPRAALLLAAALALAVPCAAPAAGGPGPAAGPLTDRQRDRLRQRDRRRTKALELRAAGKLDEAAAALEEALAVEREVLGADHDKVYGLPEQLAEAHEARGDFAAARALREGVLARRLRRHGAADWRTAAARLGLENGARVEVVALVLTREPAPSVLLARSRHGAWLPPQEGVGLAEGFEEALYGCLRVECGLDVPADRHERDRVFYVRSIRYAGTLDLPRERWGERLVADDCIGTPPESATMRRKAYWVATVLVRDRGRVAPKPDGSEVLEVHWCELGEAAKLIRDSNRPAKAALLAGALEAVAGRL